MAADNPPAIRCILIWNLENVGPGFRIGKPRPFVGGKAHAIIAADLDFSVDDREGFNQTGSSRPDFPGLALTILEAVAFFQFDVWFQLGDVLLRLRRFGKVVGRAGRGFVGGGVDILLCVSKNVILQIRSAERRLKNIGLSAALSANVWKIL